jgi:dsRNA-specific ribonuclease
LVFHIEVTVGERVCTSGHGPSKKTAERAAASAALEFLHGE